MLVFNLDELNTGMVPGRGRQCSITSDKGSGKGFRKRNIGGIVSRQVVSKLPDPWQEKIIGISEQRKVGKIF